MLKRRIVSVSALLVIAMTIAFFAVPVFSGTSVSADSNKPVFDDDGLDYGHDGSYVEFENIPDGTYGYKIYSAWCPLGGMESAKGLFVYKLSAQQLRNYRFCHVSGTDYYQDLFIVLPENYMLSKPASSTTLTKVIKDRRNIYTFKDNMGYWEYPEYNLYTYDKTYYIYEYDSSGKPVLVEDKAVNFNANYIIWLGDNSKDVITASIRSINEFDIGLKEPSKTFDGKPIKPEVTGLTNLTEGEDYTVEYDQSACLAGDYKVVVSPVEGRLTGDPIELTYTVNDPSGNCGFYQPEDATWHFNSNTGVLDIKGTGEMDVYDTGSKPAPWTVFKDFIKTVNIGDGITSAGNYAFLDCSNLTTVNLAISVDMIAGHAFDGCTSLTDINNTDNLKTIYDYAFSDCSSLKTVVLSQSLQTISRNAFYKCSSISDIYCYAEPGVWKDGNYHDCFKPDKGTLCHLSAANYERYHSYELLYDLNLTYVEDISAVREYGYKMILDDGVLGVDFYFKNMEEVNDSTWDHVKFTFADGSSETKTDHEYNVLSQTGFFTVNMPAKSINDPVRVQLFSADGKALSGEFVFSPAQYADYIYNNPSLFDDGRYNPLIESLLSYGASAQYYFGNGKYPMDYSYIVTEYQDSDIAAAAEVLSSGYQNFDLNGLDDIYVGSSLVLNSETTLKLYFAKDSGITGASGAGGNVKVSETDNYTVVEISKIKWQMLGTKYDIVLTVGGTDKTINVSPMTYVYKVLSGDYSGSLKNLVMSLYNLYNRSNGN